MRSDPVEHVRRLKGRQCRDPALRRRRLAATVASEIDRLVIKLNPVSLGAGRPLFDGAYDPRSWRLESTRAFELGVVLLEYTRQDRPADE